MNTPEALKQAQSAAPKHTGFVLVFYSTKDTDATALVNEFVPEVIDQYKDLKFEQIDIDNVDTASIVAAFNVTTTPTFITVLDKTTLAHVQGMDAPEIITALEALNNKAIIHRRIYGIINQSPWVLLMKGTKDTPRCGFSRQMITLLQENGLQDFTTFDILGDQEVREENKIYNNWPTYPQLFNNGELLGGLDVIKGMAQDGELVELIGQKE